MQIFIIFFVVMAIGSSGFSTKFRTTPQIVKRCNEMQGSEAKKRCYVIAGATALHADSTDVAMSAEEVIALFDRETNLPEVISKPENTVLTIPPQKTDTSSTTTSTSASPDKPVPATDATKPLEEHKASTSENKPEDKPAAHKPEHEKEKAKLDAVNVEVTTQKKCETAADGSPSEKCAITENKKVIDAGGALILETKTVSGPIATVERFSENEKGTDSALVTKTDASSPPPPAATPATPPAPEHAPATTTPTPEAAALAALTATPPAATPATTPAPEHAPATTTPTPEAAALAALTATPPAATPATTPAPEHAPATTTPTPEAAALAALTATPPAATPVTTPAPEHTPATPPATAQATPAATTPSPGDAKTATPPAAPVETAKQDLTINITTSTICEPITSENPSPKCVVNEHKKITNAEGKVVMESHTVKGSVSAVEKLNAASAMSDQAEHPKMEEPSKQPDISTSSSAIDKPLEQKKPEDSTNATTSTSTTTTPAS